MVILASACLGQDDRRAASLFRGLAREHDLHEAWCGLAAALLRLGQPHAAAQALGPALRRHAWRPDSRALVDAIARASGAPGYCGLASDGSLFAMSIMPGSIEAGVVLEPTGQCQETRRYGDQEAVSARITGRLTRTLAERARLHEEPTSHNEPTPIAAVPAGTATVTITIAGRPGTRQSDRCRRHPPADWVRRDGGRLVVRLGMASRVTRHRSGVGCA